jgi:hypothetical protein
MSEVTVKTQKDWDAIPNDFNGVIYINAAKETIIIVRERKGWRVEAWDNSSVEAWDNSSVVARDNSSVEAWDNSSVVARDNSSVVARDNSSVEAWDNSSVVARDNSSVVARDNSSVEAWGNSSVVAFDNSSVEAWDNSSVVARDNSNVVARDNSSVEAWDNSSVVARDNSSVAGQGNTQICQYSDTAKIQTIGNSRIVWPPRTVKEYCDFYGVKVQDGHAVLYKALYKSDDKYISPYNNNFTYEVNEIKTYECDSRTERDYSFGLHVAHMPWCIDLGRDWDNLAILECIVPLDCIVLPKNTNGKVRTSKLTVVREVPPNEWGIYGKVFAKRTRP